MQERFTFAPSEREIQVALRVLKRSIAGQTTTDARRVISFAAVYGVPLGFAAVFFTVAFDQILVILLLLVVVATTVPRLLSGSSAMAERLSVDTDVGFGADGIKQVTGTTETSWSWASLNRLHVAEGLVVPEFRDWSWIALPDRLWVNDSLKVRFLDDVCGRADQVQPFMPDKAASPFSLVNVAAGFGAFDVFLLSLVILAITSAGCRCAAAWHLGGHPMPFGVVYGATLAFAIATFFPIRLALRAIDRRRHVIAVVIGNLLIWLMPLALVITTNLR